MGFSCSKFRRSEQINRKEENNRQKAERLTGYFKQRAQQKAITTATDH